MQELPSDEAGQETPGTGSSQINQILESINALASSVAPLHVQADIERRLPQQGARKAATLRRAPTQARRADTIGTRKTRGILTPAPTAAVPTSPAQTFQPAPALTPCITPAIPWAG